MVHGLIIIKECIKKKIDIFPIPGVSAVTTAMSASGFDDKYFFYGFLSKKSSEIEKNEQKPEKAPEPVKKTSLTGGRPKQDSKKGNSPDKAQMSLLENKK